MARFVDPLIRINFVDANILDDFADGQDEAVNELRRLKDNEIVNLLIPHSVKTEVEHPNTPAHVKRAVSDFGFSLATRPMEPECSRYETLLAAASGNADAKNIESDLFHVCEAGKYGHYFITRDERLLKRADIILRVVDVAVMKPSEFLAIVTTARKRAKELGLKGKR